MILARVTTLNRWTDLSSFWHHCLLRQEAQQGTPYNKIGSIQAHHIVLITFLDKPHYEKQNLLMTKIKRLALPHCLDIDTIVLKTLSDRKPFDVVNGF